ncbi:hypothetical protein [Streptomyces sp. SP18CS02]|uniref:hypothetical protein n=1 Tax=Streptomyces sp. SP18CS02 TaxID=3002531 RepID=UPI002E77D279|nr:hypothetical protein [Streptomyces sp. SP18CS02]MEE1751552.1 hypothetical protein [Streptomyces sp. SP18CS02]
MTTTTPGSIAATTALLQEELPRLENQQQTLEKELATVTGRLESVRAALSALHSLTETAPVDQPTATSEPKTEPVSEAASEPTADPASSPSTEAELATGPKASSSMEEQSVADIPAPRKPRRARASASAGKTRKAAAGKKDARAAKPAAAQKEPQPAAKKTARSPQPKAKAAKAAKATPAATVDNSGAGLTEQVLRVLSSSGDNAVRSRDVAQELGRDASSNSINAVRSTLDRLVATSRAQRVGPGLYRAVAA